MEGGISGRHQTRSGRIIRPPNKAIHNAMVDAAETERRTAAAERKTAQVAKAKKGKTAKKNNRKTKCTTAGSGGDRKKEAKRRNFKHEEATKRLTSFVYTRQPGSIQMLCRVIENPTCILQNLSLGCVDVTDRMLVPLLDALQFNQSVKWLGLVGSLGERVSMTTWNLIARNLRCQFSGLETLDIRNSIGLMDNEQIHAELCDALYQNKKLTHLLLFDYLLTIDISWERFSRLLCNPDSIAATFSSNHTLQKVVHKFEQPGELMELLAMNENAGKYDIARRKIIKVHFTREDMEWTSHFDDMDIAILPRLIAWMARGDCTMSFRQESPGRGKGLAAHKSQLVEELSFFYKFVRSMPLMFDFHAAASPPSNSRGLAPLNKNVRGNLQSDWA